ncbi:hypothetical protein C6B37_00270 [Candidatus Phytoplasma phoenicium]|uniref:YitT family protein n=1 Tax=Candidatus Phytoplasma phoenicium TaxID=198422 RepID=A0A2S8NVH1_9MOLU|nr:hypothetical protein C6B37_00270 [Candidatus Phytoplasma phoenicium]
MYLVKLRKILVMLKTNKDNGYFKNQFVKWFWLIFHTFILSLGIYVFTFGFELVTGGLDGLTVLTMEIFRKCGVPKSYISPIYLYGFYNVISLILGYKVFGKDFFYHTVVLFVILFLSVYFLNFFLGPEIIFVFCISDNVNLQLLFVSFFSGILFGISLGNIRKYEYTTGGMDILQKILKDIYGINFVLVVLITDGILIFLTAILISFKTQDLMQIIIRIFLSYLSSFIMSFIIEKIAPEIQTVKKNF